MNKRANLNDVMAMLTKQNEILTNLTERVSALEEQKTVSAPKASAPKEKTKKSEPKAQKSSRKTSAPKEQKVEVDPKDFAPKSLTNYDSVKAARANFVRATLGVAPKVWIATDQFTEAAKPFDELYGKWVAGKGLKKSRK